MKKYTIIYENGEKGSHEVSEKDTMISVISELQKMKVKSISIADIEMKLKTINIPVIFYSKDRDYFSVIYNNTTLEELIKQAKLINTDMLHISFDEKKKKIALEELREEDLQKLVNNKKGNKN